jgi:hypothetical protein
MQKMIGAALCLTLLSGEVLPASAAQVQKSESTVASVERETVEPLTPEVPAVETDELHKRPVGGVQQVEYLELPESVEGVETFSGEVDEELLNIQEVEGINGSRSSTYGYSTLTSEEKKVYNLLKSRLFAFDASSKSATCIEVTYSRSYYASESVDVSDYQMTLHWKQITRCYSGWMMRLVTTERACL